MKKQHRTLYNLFIKYKNIKLIIIIILSIFGLVIWYCWHNNYAKNMIITSNTWQSISISTTDHANQLQLDTAKKFANNNHNIYGVFTYLNLAHYYAEQENFIKTEKYLQKALIQTSDINLKSIISLRLARVKLQQNNVKSALKILNNVKNRGWVTLIDDIRGDAQITKGNYRDARIAYKQALQSDTMQTNIFLRMKLNNLPDLN